MMSKSLLPCLLAVSTLGMMGCASVDKGRVSTLLNPADNSVDTTLQSDVEISCDLSNALSSENFGYFDFTIRNHSDKWKYQSDVKVSFDEEHQNKHVMVVLGHHLQAWYAAQKKQMDIDQYNKGLGLGLLAGVGIGLAELSADKTAQALGAATALGAISVLAYDGISGAVDSLEMARMIPENHLLADTLLVPPGLFSSRWILFASSDHAHMNYITNLYLEYQTESGIKEKVKIHFRKFPDAFAPIWQKTIYERQNSKKRKALNENIRAY